MTDEPLHRNVTKVIEAGTALGVEVRPHSYPKGAKTAQDAPDAIGAMHDAFVGLLDRRPDAQIVDVVRGDVDATYATVLAAIDRASRGRRSG